MKVAYFVHGRGRGHAARSVTAIARLRARGHEVAVLAGGEAELLLGGDPGFFRTRVTRLDLSTLLDLRARLTSVRALLPFSPDVVVSDGDPIGLLFAKVGGIPSVAVGHGPLFATADLPPGLPLRALATERIKAAPHVLLADRIVAVHFVPATARHPNARVARPDEPAASNVRRRPDALGPDRETIVAYFRYGDGAPYLAPFAEAGFSITVFADSIGPLPSSVRLRTPGEGFRETFEQADWVIGSAGSNLLTESIYAAKPLLALFQKEHGEQMLNALWGEAEGALLARPFGSDPTKAHEDFLAFRSRAEEVAARLRAALPTASEVITEEVEDLGHRH